MIVSLIWYICSDYLGVFFFFYNLVCMFFEVIYLKRIVILGCVKINFGKYFKILDRNLNLYLEGYVYGCYG